MAWGEDYSTVAIIDWGSKMLDQGKQCQSFQTHSLVHPNIKKHHIIDIESAEWTNFIAIQFSEEEDELKQDDSKDGELRR